MSLTEDEALMLLLHLGDGTMGCAVEHETIEKINTIQRRCGVHGDCHGITNPTLTQLKNEIHNE